MPKAFGRVQSRVENEETEVVSRPEEREMERVKEEERTKGVHSQISGYNES